MNLCSDRPCGPLDITGLAQVMAHQRGSPQVAVAVLDGPVDASHEALSGASLWPVPPGAGPGAGQRGSALMHGTAVAGILVADRGSPAPGLCPGVRLLVRPIFVGDELAVTSSATLASAIIDAVGAGAWVINISAAHSGAVSHRGGDLERALDHAANQGVIVVAAAGNDGGVGGSPIVSHPWVVPVTSCDGWGRPLPSANLGRSIARRGLRAPGTGITSLQSNGGYGPFGGTSAAAPLVTGAIALAWSAAPSTSSASVRAAIGGRDAARRHGVVPPLLDARQIYDDITRR